MNEEKEEMLRAKYQLAVILIKSHQADGKGYCFCSLCQRADRDINNHFQWQRLKNKMEQI